MAGKDANLGRVTLRFLDDPAMECAYRDDYHYRTVRQVRIALILGIVLTAAFGLLDGWVTPAARHELWFIRYAIISPFFLALLVLSFTRAALHLLQPGVALGMLLCGVGIIAMNVIAPEPGNHLYYAGLLLLFMYPPFIRMRFSLAAPVSAVLVAAYELAATELAGAPLHVLVNNTFFLSSAAAIGLLNTYLLELYTRRNFLQRIQLEAERERSERLLLNILPRSIADRLKRDSGTIADGFAEATVLFADIAGFTRIAAEREPGEVVGILNDLFSEFDSLAEGRGVEKIKTIGDAYMAVAGLPIGRADHAHAMANLALDMQEAVMRRENGRDGSFSLRIGLNSGPVVAGVIGRKKFIYDVWGDTVNTASRMESHGVPGGIHVTEGTYRLLRRDYRFEERGIVPIKGKGDMRTYLLVGRAEPVPDV